jgi:hypothetical protein
MASLDIARYHHIGSSNFDPTIVFAIFKFHVLQADQAGYVIQLDWNVQL